MFYSEGIDYSSIERHHDGYPGEFLELEEIKEGQRIFFLDGPDKNFKDWYEIVEVTWDWKRHRYNVTLWGEETERFIKMQRKDIYTLARK